MIPPEATPEAISGGELTPEDSVANDDTGVTPVELLVQLAENGEIDPWDIDIVAVTQKFLNALEEGDLRETGRTLFYASVLLRLKSETLIQDDPEPDPEPEPESEWRPPMDDGGEGGDPIAALEAEMDRRLERKPARGSPETLDELVRELREAERSSWWKSSREYDTRESSYDRGPLTLDYRGSDAERAPSEPTAESVTNRTHGEDIEATIETVADRITREYDAGRAEILFAEVETVGGSRVESFLAVLFLAHRGTLELHQDELFGDLWLRDPSADTASKTAEAE